MTRQMLAAPLLLLLLAGCATTGVVNSPGRRSTYVDPGSPGPNQGVGIESQDIQSMTDQMTRDILASPALAGRSTPPRVILDAAYFDNESSSRINKNILTDRIRVGLMRSSQGRMVFVGREYVDMVEKERLLKREGVTTPGTGNMSGATAGADYRLGGRITSLDEVNPRTGLADRYHQITFEMIDLETSQIVWSGIYEFKKASQDDILYR